MRFARSFARGHASGYILDVGPKFFLLALISDDIWFNGFQCFRIRDVVNLQRDPYARFVESALRKRRERTPRKPNVSLASIEELLISANRHFPLVTIHREQIDPDVCWIGKVQDVGRGRVSLLGITPNAAWEDSPDRFHLNEITRVDFGGDYEAALHLVGGNPPTVARAVQTKALPGRVSKKATP